MTQLTSEIAKASQTAKTDVSGARVGEDIYIYFPSTEGQQLCTSN